MRISMEHEFLLQSVKKWFNHSDQVSHYTNEFIEGPTVAEQYLLNTLPGSGSVLDVGCGTGRISVYLAERGYRVTGIDVSEGLLSVAREISTKRSHDIHFFHTEGITLPFLDEEFDIIIGFKILCYIPTRERNDYLKELYRVLKPNGICIITQNIVPDDYIDDARDEHFTNSRASHFQLLERGDNFPLGIGYVRWFTESDLLNELRNTDFEFELFESDIEHKGAGYIRLIGLRKSRKQFRGW
jgi:ubiquinone/menaquinone biosynthesis C-methylase UbiE